MSMTKEERTAYQRAWRATPEGRAKKALYAQAYRATASGKKAASEYAKKYRAKPEVRERLDTYAREKRATPEGKDYQKEYSHKYRKDFPEIKTANHAKRRAATLQRTPAWAKNDPRIKEVYRQAKIWGMDVDHYVPLQADLASGLHCWENLQLMHRSENCQKHNTWIPC